MSDTHSLVVTRAGRASRLLGTKPTEERGYVVDCGIMPSTLAPLVSILRGINLNKPDGTLDTEGPLDALLEEMEADYAAAGNEESVTFVSAGFVETIATLPDADVPKVAGQWVSLEEEIALHPDRTPQEILKLLVHCCRTARAESATVAIHSGD